MVAASGFLVITLNTWKAAGDYPTRIAAMGDGLAALSPDIVLLQEVIVAPARGTDTGARLAERLGLYHLHHPARAKRRVVAGHRVFSTSGLSVLSRWPILRSRALTLPGDPGDGERLAEFATIATGGCEVTVVNLHLTHLSYADDLRQRQLDAVIGALATWPGGDLAVLGGDFNCEPQSPPLSWLQSVAGVVARGAWEAAGGPQPTLTSADGRHAGRRCIDHLFIVHPSASRGLRWTDAARALDRRDAQTDRYPSDHFAVCGRLAIAG